MTPHVLMSGLWFYAEGDKLPYYIANVQGSTALLVRKQSNGQFTDSTHALFVDLKGIPLDRDILENSFGFTHSSTRDGYVYKEVYPAIRVTRGDNVDVVKPATYLYIDIDESGKRFTTYLECGDNKIFIAERSFVHEIQLLLYIHTDKFPLITINKSKTDEKQND